MRSKQTTKQTIPQNDGVVFLNARVRKTVDRALEERAFQLDCTKQELVEKALMEMLGLEEITAA